MRGFSLLLCFKIVMHYREMKDNSTISLHLKINFAFHMLVFL